MFGWLRPRPPLAPREKAWTETRLQRLVDLVGPEQLRAVKVVSPADESLLPPDSDPHAAARNLAERIRASFPTRLYVPEVKPEASNSAAACGASCSGCAEGAEPPERGAEQDRAAAIVELVQAMARAALVNARFPAASEGELDRAAELLSIFVGFGVFSANAAQNRRTLPARIWGYALALFAHARDETGAEWAADLHPDPQVHFQTGLRYLRRGGESLFDPQTPAQHRASRSVGQLIGQLIAGAPSARIAALWELPHIGSAAVEEMPHLLKCLQARDADVRSEAVEAIGALGKLTPEIQERLVDALHDRQEQVRASAARALGRLRADEEDVVRELAEALRDDSPLVGVRASEALQAIGLSAQAALPVLLQSFRGALVSCNDRRAWELAGTIKAVAPDGEACIREFLEEQDQDLRHAALDMLEQAALATNPEANPDPPGP